MFYVYKKVRGRKENYMYELTTSQQEMVNGGSALGALILALLGVAAYKLWKSKRGRISLPKLIQIEWGN